MLDEPLHYKGLSCVISRYNKARKRHGLKRGSVWRKMLVGQLTYPWTAERCQLNICQHAAMVGRPQRGAARKMTGAVKCQTA